MLVSEGDPSPNKPAKLDRNNARSEIKPIANPNSMSAGHGRKMQATSAKMANARRTLDVTSIL